MTPTVRWWCSIIYMSLLVSLEQKLPRAPDGGDLTSDDPLYEPNAHTVPGGGLEAGEVDGSAGQCWSPSSYALERESRPEVLLAARTLLSLWLMLLLIGCVQLRL